MFVAVQIEYVYREIVTHSEVLIVKKLKTSNSMDSAVLGRLLRGDGEKQISGESPVGETKKARWDGEEPICSLPFHRA
tara:strand:- start:22083 stop:22316 length:234 start_codon:yes stop_codon:yes gene_type:complete